MRFLLLTVPAALRRYTARCARIAAELRVTAGDGDVVEEDVAVGMAARAGDGAVEEEPRSRVGAPFDDQERRTLREGVDARDGRILCGGLRLGEEVRAEDRSGLRGALRWHARPVIHGHLGVSSCG